MAASTPTVAHGSMRVCEQRRSGRWQGNGEPMERVLHFEKHLMLSKQALVMEAGEMAQAMGFGGYGCRDGIGSSGCDSHA
ncbi:hypothetical protein COCNU_scaffold024778G000010 [Cocos nucifera]|nr:hypothetical protein [Cocos nucifera]